MPKGDERDLTSKEMIMKGTILAFLAAILLGLVTTLAQPSAAGFGHRLLSGLIMASGAVGVLGLLILVVKRYLDDAPKTAWIDLYALLAIVLVMLLSMAVMKTGFPLM
jgi:hypothetical protein